MRESIPHLDELRDSSMLLLYGSYKASRVFFIVPALLMLFAFGFSAFVHFDISIRCPGITRPANERTEIKSILSGSIDTIYYQEGSLIKKDAVLLKLKDHTSKNKVALNKFELERYREFAHDLGLLTKNKIDSMLIGQLNSPLYRQEAAGFIQRLAGEQASLKKANKEIAINSVLAKENVISPKEFFDLQIQQEKINASYKAVRQEQLSKWQGDLVKYESALLQEEAQTNQLERDAASYEIRAPVTGIIQDIHTRYQGSMVQANETICSVSPEGSIIAECYVSSRDIGLIGTGQTVHFQVDAFDYNYFGILTGQVISIDNDFTLSNEKPVFKVRCNFCNKEFHIRNPLTARLKKGLTLQARFIIGQRTVWQLLFDKMDNWLNPVAPPAH